PQTHEAVEEVIDVVLPELLAEPEVGTVRRIEVARGDACDPRLRLVEPDRLADDVGIAVIELAPDAVRDDDDRRRRRRPRRRLLRVRPALRRAARPDGGVAR